MCTIPSMTDRVAGRIANHPTVQKVLANKAEPPPAVIDADWLRERCLSAGADDVAFASVENPDLASEREHVESALPGTKSFISLVVRMNRDNVRSPARSVANQEFQFAQRIFDFTDEQLRELARNSFEASFLPAEKKLYFLNLLDATPTSSHR